MNRKFLSFLAVLPLLQIAQAEDTDLSTLNEAYRIQCGKITYSKNKTAVCFADKFLERFKTETHLEVAPKFKPVRLDSDEIFETPFCAWSGENSFRLTEKERDNLRAYLWANLALVAAVRGEPDEARARLERARGYDPELPHLREVESRISR